MRRGKHTYRYLVAGVTVAGFLGIHVHDYYWIIAASFLLLLDTSDLNRGKGPPTHMCACLFTQCAHLRSDGEASLTIHSGLLTV